MALRPAVATAGRGLAQRLVQQRPGLRGAAHRELEAREVGQRLRKAPPVSRTAPAQLG